MRYINVQAISERFRDKELIYKTLYKFSSLLYFTFLLLTYLLTFYTLSITYHFSDEIKTIIVVVVVVFAATAN